MTREELDRMWCAAMDEAIKAGEQFTRYRFAEMVAAAEREACAQICEHGINAEHYPTLLEVADAIRARGEA